MKDLQERLAGLGPEQRAAFLERLRDRGVDLSRLPIPPRAPGSGPAPMSPAQERLWLLSRLEGTSAVYNEPYHARFEGPLDPAALDCAIRLVVRRHGVLRTTLDLSPSGQPIQRVWRVEAPGEDGGGRRAVLPVVDLTGLPRGHRDRAGDGALAAEAGRAFDLEKGPLVRFFLIRRDAESHELVADLHHTICDARSVVLLARELGIAYAALSRGVEPGLPELPIGYDDYSAWLREWHLPGVVEKHLGYWLDALGGAPTVLELPTDRPRPPVQGVAGDRIVAALPDELRDAVAELGRREGVTPFMIGLAAFAVLVGRVTTRRDLLIGTPVENRTRPEVRDLIGFFVNTLPLRIEPDPGATVREHLAAVRRTVGAGFEHQDLPFATLVERLAPERSPAHSPLVQVLFVNQRPAVRVEEDEGPVFALRRIENRTAKFDLTLVLREREGRLDCEVEYRTELFDASTILRWVRSYRSILEGMAAAPHRSLGALPLPAAEEIHVLREWNDTRRVRRSAGTVLDRIARWAEASPDAVALVHGAEAVSYRELDRRTRRLAVRLRRAGVAPETVVGLVLPPSVDAVVGILGIQRAGGAYLPIDPAYPEERIRHLAEGADLRFLVTRSDLDGELPTLPGLRPGAEGRILTDRAAVARDEDADGVLEPVVDPLGLAYVIFTSGSTGRPKGVMIHHHGLLGLTEDFVELFDLTPGDRALLFLSLSFDASIGDVFPTLVAGATLEIPPGKGLRGGAELQRLCEEHRIDSLELSSAFWHQWVEDIESRPGGRVPPSLHTVVAGGDSVTAEAVARWLEGAAPGSRLLHNYGPTEASVCTASERAVRGGSVRTAGDRLRLGRPLPDVTVHVLDPDLRPQSVGIPGELAIGGRGVARGYLGRPAATARVFVPDPFTAAGAGRRIYRTGDLARWQPDGTLEFLGRIDRQVKVRGFRIDPGEVEAALAEHPAVASVAVVARRDEHGGGVLVAYVAGNEGSEPPMEREVRSFLASRLPEHMVPSTVVTLAAMPLTVHGKVDRSRLPEPRGSLAPGEEGSDDDRSLADTTTERVGEPAPPSGELQRTVAAIWCDLLGRERVGVHENFFDLGGHSLLLLRVQTRLAEALEREIPAADLFRFPTVASLAEHLEEGRRDRAVRRGGRTESDRGRFAPGRPGGRPAPGAVAIVGMAGRFPGAATVETFWKNLVRGVEGLSDLSDEDLADAGVPKELAADPSYVRRRGLLAGYDRFDAPFFGIAPREAQLLDPQHRVFLETSWEALEDAGYDPGRFPGAIGLFAGTGRQTYLLQNLLSNPELIRSVGVTQIVFGNEKDFVPTRVAYKLGLRGPAVNVQTACSTSLVAVHLACRSLQAGDCDLALAGGVSIAVPHAAGYPYDKGGIFSPDGHCRAYGADAAGTVPSTGSAVVVLKPLERALDEGDTVRAVLRATAINNDGATKVGYSAPGVGGQEAVVRRALDEAGVEPGAVGFVEGHGTGTSLGDLVEVSALRAVYGDRPRPEEPCRLGSLKTNLGHMDCAAGVAGLMKAALAVERGVIPPSLHARSTDPRLELDRSPFEVNSEAVSWVRRNGGERPRLAAVSSFGIGGTNVHALVEEPPPVTRASAPAEPSLIRLSARSAQALDEVARRLAERLESTREAELSLGDVAYTLRVGRRAFEHRRAILPSGSAAGPAAARAGIVAALRGERPLDVVDGLCDRETPPAVLFLFPGGGTQYPGMGEGLYRREPVFRAVIDRAAEILEDHCRAYPATGGEPDLRRLLYPADEDRERLAVLQRQPAIFMPTIVATECALAELWRSRGVEPASAIGHSLGEYAAAWLAGVLSLEDVLLLVARRGELMESVPAGAMIGVSLSREEIEPRLGENTSVAVVNQPGMCTVSGPKEALAELRRELEAEGVDTRELHIEAAAHSPSLDPVLPAFREAVSAVSLSPPTLPFVTNVTGDWATREQATDPDHWVRQLRGTVRFSDGLATLSDGGARDGLFLEVGPSNVLSTVVRQQPWWTPEHRVVASMPRPNEERSDQRAFLEATVDLWLAGVDVAEADPAEPRRRVPLPTYPFERERFWVEPRGDRTSGFVEGGASGLTESAAPAVDERDEHAGVAASAGPVGRRTSKRPLVTPRTETERVLAALWEEMLGVAPVGVLDDYYELGGHSLLAIRILARAREAFDVDLATEALFEAPTVEGLAERVAAARGRAPAGSAGGEAPPQGATLPLSVVQRDVLRHLDDPGGLPQHNASATYRGRGPLDLPALAAALARIVRRHEILRTHYPWVNGERRQRIDPPAPIALPVIDLQALPEEARLRELRRISRDDYERTWDLENGPLWAVTVLRLGPEDHGVVRTFQRLTTDGVSIGLWTVELIAFYEALVEGEEIVPETPLQYRHFTRRQLDALPETRERSLAYWRRRLDPPPPALDLATDRPRPPVVAFRGDRLPVAVDAEITRTLRELGRSEGASLFLVVLSAVEAILGRAAGSDDFAVATPVTHRDAVTHTIMGRFINTVPLRADLTGDPTFRELVCRTRERAMADFSHKELSFETVVETLGLGGDPSRRPVAQVAYLLDELPYRDLRLGEVAMEGVPVRRGTSDFDLTVGFRSAPGGGLDGFLEYRNDLFDVATVEGMARRIERVLLEVAGDPDRPLSRVFGEGVAAAGPPLPAPATVSGEPHV